jgi:hypothetical protein
MPLDPVIPKHATRNNAPTRPLSLAEALQVCEAHCAALPIWGALVRLTVGHAAQHTAQQPQPRNNPK